MVGLKQNPFLSLFSPAPCGSMGAAEGLNEARETTLLSILAHWVVLLA